MSDFRKCCEAVLASPKADAYAKAYAATGIAQERLGSDFQRVQALYILSNLSHWRVPEAKDIKARLRKIATSAKTA